MYWVSMDLIWSTRNRVGTPSSSVVGRNTAAIALRDVGTMVATLHAIELGLMTKPYRLPRCSWPGLASPRSTLYQVVAVDPRYAWALGDLIEKWNGTSWQQLPNPNHPRKLTPAG